MLIDRCEDVIHPKQQAQENAICSKNIAKSIARAEKDNSCDYEILTNHEIRCLLKATEDNTCYASVLLRLSLLLGRSIESLFSSYCVYVKPQEQSKFFGYGFIEVYRDFPCSHLGESQVEKRENRGFICIPVELANTFEELKIVELTDAGIINIIDSVKSLLKEVNQTLGRRITLARIKRYFRYYCSHNGKSEVRFGVIAGKELGHHAGAYYTALQNRQIVELQTEYIEYLEEIYGNSLYSLATPENVKCWGSLRLPDRAEISRYLAQLKSKCKIARFENKLIHAANLYTAYTLTILQMATGHRPELEAFGVISMFDLDAGFVFIDDKKSGANHHRIVKLGETAQQQLRFYYKHLEKLRELSKSLYPNLHKNITKAIKGEAAFLSYIEGDEFRTTMPLRKPAMESFPESISPSNFYRHLLRTHLDESSVDSDLIDWFFGHESKRDHSWGKYSSLDFDCAELISIEVEKMLKKLDASAYRSPLMGL